MWDLSYDGTRQGLIFFPYSASGSTELFTGLNSAPADTWFKVEVQYTATATGGGAQLYINGQTQAGWGVTGDYTRTANLQRLQLWNDGPNAVDFDDVSIAVPPGAASIPGAPTGVSGVGRQRLGRPQLDGARLRRRQRDHRLPDHAVHRRRPRRRRSTGSAATSRTVTGLTNGTRVHVHRRGDQRSRHRPRIGALGRADPLGRADRARGAGKRLRRAREQVGHAFVDRAVRRRQCDHGLPSYSRTSAAPRRRRS